MDDLVAIEVSLSEGGSRFFLVYGRIFGAVEAEALEAVVLKAARRSDYGGTAISASLCASLREAAGEPYFFEALFEMSRDAVPPSNGRYGRWKYGQWKRRSGRAMREGREIWFLGAPR